MYRFGGHRLLTLLECGHQLSVPAMPGLEIADVLLRFLQGGAQFGLAPGAFETRDRLVNPGGVELDLGVRIAGFQSATLNRIMENELVEFVRKPVLELVL